MSIPSLLAKARGGGGPVSDRPVGAGSGSYNNNNDEEHDEESEPLFVASALPPPGAQARVEPPSVSRGGPNSRRRQGRHQHRASRRNRPGTGATANSSAYSSSSSSSSHYLNPMCWRALVVLSVMAVGHVSRQQQQTVTTYLRMNEDLERRFFASGLGGGLGEGSPDPQRCVEDLPQRGDDAGKGGGRRRGNTAGLPASAALVAMAAEPPDTCRCMDPLLPAPKKFPKWVHRHEQLTEMASHAAMDGADVLVVGDSIVEHFSGTRDMGQQRPGPENDEDRREGKQSTEGEVSHRASVLEELREQARAYAAFSAEANLVALGCSGDTTNQLLFHLKYGMLPPQLRPKIFVVAIGTNNLGSSGCNARTTLAGILQVAQYLHQQRPEAIVVVHGLLPRSDHRHEEGPLHRYWGQILWINRQLKKFCSLHDEWRYFDVNKRLLEGKADAPYKVALKPGLLPDGLHPSVEGYRIWSEEVSKLIAKLLSEDEDEDEDAADEREPQQGEEGTVQEGKNGHDRKALVR